MARRKSRVRTVYRTARRKYRKRASGIVGKFKPAIAGAICGAAPNFVRPFLGQWSDPVVCGGVGYLMNDKTAMFMAGYSAGAMLGGNGGYSNGGVR